MSYIWKIMIDVYKRQILDGIMRCIMIGASGGDIQFISYMGHMVMPTVFWNAILGGIGHKLMGLMEEKEDYIW